MSNLTTLTPDQRARQRRPELWSVEPVGLGFVAQHTETGRMLAFTPTGPATYDVTTPNGEYCVDTRFAACSCPDALHGARIEGRCCYHVAAALQVREERARIAVEIHAARTLATAAADAAEFVADAPRAA